MPAAPTTFTIASTADLTAAIAAIDVGGSSANPGVNYTFNFTASVTLASQIQAINLMSGSTLTVNGGGFTLDGGSTQQGFLVYSGAVTVYSLNLDDLSTTGGSGGAGGGGGSGGAGGGTSAFGGGTGATGISPTNQGGGGLGAGGAIFVQNGGSLTIQGGVTVAGSVTAGASGGGTAGPGSAYGGAIFLQGTATATLQANGGVLAINNTIADEAGNGGAAGNQGGLIISGAGGVVDLHVANSYSGGTALNVGTLVLDDIGAAGSGAITFGVGGETLAFSVNATGFAPTLKSFGAGDVIEIQGVGTATTESVAANILTVKVGAATVGTFNLNAADNLTTGNFALASDGRGGTKISYTVAAVPVGGSAPATPTAPTPTPTASDVEALFKLMTGLAISDPKVTAPTITLANGQAAVNPLYTEALATFQIENQYRNGAISFAQAFEQMMPDAGSTTAVAMETYQFFTGAYPSAAGLAYLVSSTANPTNLTAAYYAGFNEAARFENMAVGLGTGAGAGATTFQQAYSGLTFDQAVRKAYDAVIGNGYAIVHGYDVNAAVAYLDSQQAYFTQVGGGTDIGAKAAMVGYLMSVGFDDRLGVYYDAVHDSLAGQVTLAGQPAPAGTIPLLAGH